MNGVEEMIYVCTFALVFIAVGLWFVHMQLQTMHESHLETLDEVRRIRRVVVTEMDDEPEWNNAPYLS